MHGHPLSGGRTSDEMCMMTSKHKPLDLHLSVQCQIASTKGQDLFYDIIHMIISTIVITWVPVLNICLTLPNVLVSVGKE